MFCRILGFASSLVFCSVVFVFLDAAVLFSIVDFAVLVSLVAPVESPDLWWVSLATNRHNLFSHNADL